MFHLVERRECVGEIPALLLALHLLTVFLQESDMRRHISLSLVLVLVLASASLADYINYGTFSASTVVYHNVTEDSGVGNPLRFGAPTVSGDTMDFNPIFKSQSSGGASGFVDSQLLYTVVANEGKYVDDIKFTEAGDYRLIGSGTTSTCAMVANNLFVDIYEVWNSVTNTKITINPIQVLASMTFSPSSGDYYLTVDPATGVWTGTSTADLTAALAANGYANYHATRVSINLDNTLLTQSELNTTAYIAKKDAKGLAITADTLDVPEPASMSLLALGALGLLCRCRKA